MQREGTYKPSAWEESLEQHTNGLRLAPKEMVVNGRTYSKTTKHGQKLAIETKSYSFENKRYYGFFAPCPSPGEGLRHYMLAHDESGGVVGMYVTTIFREDDKLVARSYVEVRDKGKGLASPLDEAFFEDMQALADQEGRPVVWETENQNLEKLKEYKASGHIDPNTLAALEEEQKRWQHLYGEGGKYGVKKGKKIFKPQTMHNNSV